jgi:hypothetical protein
MAVIIDQSPYFETPGDVRVLSDQVLVRANQIIVWASLARWGEDLDPEAPRFPVVLDTGHTHNLSISQLHLREWAGIEFAPDDAFRRLQISGVGGPDRVVALCKYNVWLHKNIERLRDTFVVEPAHELETDGVAFYPATTSESPIPRLPLLGLRSITRNGLKVLVDGANRTVSTST